MKAFAAILVPVCALVFSAALSSPPSDPDRQVPAAPGDVIADLTGAWSGSATHEGESITVGLELESLPGGAMAARLTLPVVYLERMAVAKAAPQVQGSEVRIGLLTLRYDRAARALSGILPEALAPVYKIPFTLHRVDNVDDLVAAIRSRPEPAASTGRCTRSQSERRCDG
jgi:hypothetical protein